MEKKIVGFLNSTFGCILALVVFAMIILYVFFVFPAQMEARTYNKITGSNVSWFDALWVELRIQR